MEEMHYFRKVDIKWELPALLSSSPLPQGLDPSSANGLGRANFGSWCRRFVNANIAHQAVIAQSTNLLLEAYAATLELQLSGKWTEPPTAYDAMNDEWETVFSGVVEAVLEELGIMTPQPIRRDSVISIGSSSSVSTTNDQRPSSSGTSGTDVPRSSSGGDATSIVEDDMPNIKVTGSNDCNKVASKAPFPLGKDNKDDADSADGMDKTEDTDTLSMDAPKQQPRPKRPASPDMEELAAATEAELRELERYFPAVAKDAIFCVGCATYGHRIQSCPLRTCRLCDGSIGDHGLFGCPALSPTDVVFRIIAPLKTVPVKKGKNSNRKGKGKKEKERAKARELEEAAWVPEPERPARMCKLCLQVMAHQDVCPMLWTTFVPNPLLKRKADRISASCYFCGADGHFGGDCSKNTGTHLSGRQFSLPDDIWCQKYADKCIGSDAPETSTSSKEESAIGKQTPAKRAKTSAEANTPSTATPSPAQKPAGGKPTTPTLSKAQIKKANRKQRLAEEARSVLAKQSKASKANKAQTALQTELPSRSAPMPMPTPQKSEKAEKQAPAETSAARDGVAVEGIKGLAGTGKTAPMPASKVYDLSKQKTHLPLLKVLEKKPAKQPAKQPQPPTKKKAKAKQARSDQPKAPQKQNPKKANKQQKPAQQPNQPNQQNQQKPKQQQSAQQQPAQQPPAQSSQPGQPAKLTRKQRKQTAIFASAKANAQAQQTMQGMPGQGPNMRKARPPRRRRRAADEMDI